MQLHTCIYKQNSGGSLSDERLVMKCIHDYCNWYKDYLWYVYIGSSAMHMSDSEFLPALNITDLTCREDFFERNFTCLPRCDRWDERPQNFLAAIEDIVRTVSAILKQLTTTLFLVVFAIRRKTLWVFQNGTWKLLILFDVQVDFPDSLLAALRDRTIHFSWEL